MPIRTIYDATTWSTDFYDDPRRPALLDWLNANGINPDHLPVEQRIVLEDDTIRYVAYAAADDGSKIKADHGPLLQPGATPCTVRPPAELSGTGCTCGEPQGDDEDDVAVRRRWMHSRSCPHGI